MDRQEVRAKDLPKVCDDLGVLPLDDVDCAASPRRNVDSNGAVGVAPRGQGEGGTPPLPILPWWFGPECEQKLETITSSTPFQSGGEQEGNANFGSTLPYDHGAQQTGISDSNGYNVRVLTDGVVDYSASAVGEGTTVDYVSPSVAGDHQQLSINVDQYNAILAYPSVVPSPSEDRPLSSGALKAASGQAVEVTEDGQVKWTATAPSSPGTVLELSFDELKTRVRHQLEYYFSRENLAADAYLRSQMDNDQFVKITTLANFNMVKRLTTDMNVIVQALRESPVLQVNETGDKVRPIHKRCTLILREMPEGTKKEEVEELFASPQCPRIVSSEYALNGIWYVNFDTDEDAQGAFLYLRQKVKCFKGKPICARIKTAPIPRVQQNGSRPTPPNVLPLQNVSCPSTSSGSPNVMSETSQILISPSVESTFVNVPVPFPADGSAGSISLTPVDNASVSMDLAAMGLASNQIYYYHPQPIGQTPATTVVSTAQTAVSSGWPAASPNSFDLGYILQLNGFQAQGAYRPAMYVPAASISPLCHVGAPVGVRFGGDKPPRKNRAGGSSYSGQPQTVDGGGAQSADSTRPPPSYGRCNSMSTPRSANGYFAERKGFPYYRDQSYYTNVRGRPNRYGVNGNHSGGGPSMNYFGGFSADTRPRYIPRGERGGRYGHNNWNSGSYQTKFNRKFSTGGTGPNATLAATTSETTVSTAKNDEKAEESFDLHSSSFPPLPTTDATSAVKDNLEHDTSKPVADPPGVTSSSNADSQLLQILQREQHGEQTSVVPSSSPVVKVQPRMKKTFTGAASNAIDEKSTASVTSSVTAAVAPLKFCDAVTETKPAIAVANSGEQKIVTANLLAPSVHRTVSSVAARVINTTIPVAVVQPNAQAKPQKVTTADKATTTDTPPPTTRADEMAEDSSFTKASIADAKSVEVSQTKATSDAGKKTSYADMAKHAAIRTNYAAIPLSNATAVVQRNSWRTGTGSGNFAAGKNQESTHHRADKDGQKWREKTESGSELDEEGDYPRFQRVKNTYSGSLRKQTRLNLGAEDQQEYYEHLPSSTC